MSSHFTTFQTTYCLANRAVATSANSESMETNSTMLSLVTSWKKRMMPEDVLLRNTQPNWCLATQSILEMKDQAGYASASFHLLGQKKLPSLVLIVFAYQLMLSLHLDTLVLVVVVVLVYYRRHPVRKIDSCIFPFVRAALYAKYRFVQYGLSISPKHPTNHGQADDGH